MVFKIEFDFIKDVDYFRWLMSLFPLSDHLLRFFKFIHILKDVQIIDRYFKVILFQFLQQFDYFLKTDSSVFK